MPRERAKNDRRSREPRRPALPPASAGVPAGRITVRDWIAWLLPVAAVLIAFWPALSGGFIWDDDAHVIANPCIVGPQGLWDIWTTSAARICPLVLSTFWLEYKLWGMNPLPYHLVNILVHAASGLVLWRVLRALGVRGAWLGALLWAVHPVQTESVAWITELKNTQSGLFYLLSVLFYVRMLRAQQQPGVAQICNLHLPPGKGTLEGSAAAGSHGGRDYAWALVFGALGMASKTSVVVLPVVLALCGWWVEGRWRWSRLKWLAPLVLMALGAAVLALWTQHLEGANHEAWARSVPERIVAAGCVVWFYLGKLLWPHPLIFIYPRWEIDAGNLLWWVPVLSLVLGFGLLWKGRGRGWVRALLFGLGYFVVALVPVLGLADHYFLRYSFVGDHFQYLASMGPLALAGAGLSVAWRPRSAGLQPAWRRGALALCVALLLVMGSLSWRECRKYLDDQTLWRTTLAQNPRCWMAHNNLGTFHNRQGEFEEAMEHFSKAIEIRPDFAEVHTNLGNTLLQKGRLDEALAHYRRSLECNPDLAEAHNNLGNALQQKGRLDEATAQFEKAVELRPGYAEAHNNLGNALQKKGRLDDAMAHFETAITIDPNFALAHSNLGVLLGDVGRIEDAVTRFQRAIEIDPGFAPAYNNLGSALQRKGRMREALAHYQKAVELNRDDPQSLNNLAYLLATIGQASLRDGARAVELAQRAGQLTGGGDPAILGTLAAAHAESGGFPTAVETVQQAIRLAETQGQGELASLLRQHLELYRNEQPLRNEP